MTKICTEDLCILGAIAPSVKELEKVPEEILSTGASYWTRTPADTPEDVFAVNKKGRFVTTGIDYISRIRPMLVVDNDLYNDFNIKENEEIILFYTNKKTSEVFQWEVVAISPHRILFPIINKPTHFSEKYDNNNYYNSKLRDVIEQWFKEFVEISQSQEIWDEDNNY